MKIRRSLAALVGMVLAIGILTPSAAWAVNPGSVTPIINTTPGSGSLSFHANAVGWYRGTIAVSYTMYDGPSASGPWSYYYSDSHTCYSSTACSTSTQDGACSNGWYKMVARASGPGGNAENNGASVTKYVWGTLGAVAPQTRTSSFSWVIPASIAAECRYKTTPI
ncbi:hypothetical protein [Nostocoides sp. HKS02]|uniref:hypothetical protein n=1 Tax=Nostocoides sp. HKS02 TaxID=1813880 RepID=UPI0012B4CA1F|nr:hypothetical protein [Tetrasphaera sp. HKS02]QGN58776.1 hypothetical protein GKE56_13820 [Tetrasphaera sp. HKS02]